ncbi:bifunctional diguanylate cyclase/phosphodiesterase [Arsenicicoccus piscis]|uniref:putative bifunctional diguanylate cyclase/phosphodiesterase n=1 Tax=Arsenicicoccus piscis TaxID=673954 RepID=UPI001F4CFA39|nr:bifunctional diguanylate cyclase/phosphodiesterase [Arsenicicoccus piscis]
MATAQVATEVQMRVRRVQRQLDALSVAATLAAGEQGDGGPTPLPSVVDRARAAGTRATDTRPTDTRAADTRGTTRTPASTTARTTGERAPWLEPVVGIVTDLLAAREGTAEQGLRLATRGLTLADAVADPAWRHLFVAQCEAVRTWALLAASQIDEAEVAAERAQDAVAERLPEHELTGAVRATVAARSGAVAMAREEFDRAARRLSDAAEQDAEAAHPLQGEVEILLAALMRTVGEPGLGLPYLERALDRVGPSTPPGVQAPIYAEQARLLVDNGRLDLALAAAERAAELVELTDLSPVPFRLLVADVKSHFADRYAATDLEALAEAEQAADGLVPVETSLALARARQRLGDPEGSLAALADHHAVSGLPRRIRNDVYDLLAQALTDSGDLLGALKVLQEQKRADRLEDRHVTATRVAELVTSLRHGLLESDLQKAIVREEQLRTLVRQRTAELTWRTAHDELTGLFSREAVVERLAMPLLPGGWRTVAFVDLDRFRVVNDAHGHRAGDVLLTAVGRRLETGALRLPGRTTVARLGGDEFVVIVDSADEINPIELARDVQGQICQPVDVPGLGPVRPDASVGVVQVGPAGPRAELVEEHDLLRDAESALHRAKAEGGGQVWVFGESDRRAALRRFEVELELRRAIAEGRVRAAYDPIVSLADGAVVGVECLSRLLDGDRVVPAAEFIDIAEESGLVDQLGALVTQQAFADLAAAHQPWFVAVNLSARELRREDLAAELSGWVGAAGLTMDRVVVEVTERSFVHAASTEASCLFEIARAGAGLAIDDFSTGHSSMVHLSWMPLTLLKIDRSLVVRAAYSGADRTLVSAVITMAQTLGLNVVAEGVESVELYQVMRELGCDYAQGHLFGEYQRVSDIPEVYDIDAVSGPPDDLAE